MTSYGEQISYGIEVPDEKVPGGWRLAAIHPSEEKALNDLRWRKPYRIARVLTNTVRLDVVHGQPSPVVFAHTVFLIAYGVAAERDCYCLITSGRQHNSLDSPWSQDVEPSHPAMSPPEHPYLSGETHEGYMRRMRSAQIWATACAAQAALPDAKVDNPFLDA